jgi:hypothetical protein
MGSSLQLTSRQTASAFWPTHVIAAGLTSFTSSIGSGIRADGMTATFADPSAGATALGHSGDGLGYSWIDGVAVALDTHPTEEIRIPQGENTISAGVVSVSIDGTLGAGLAPTPGADGLHWGQRRYPHAVSAVVGD